MRMVVKPVIAAGWSGNTDLMDASNSLLCDSNSSSFRRG